jgi:hypothetical protein
LRFRPGLRVRFFTAATLVTLLEEKQRQYQLDRFLTALDKADLLICDELGYLSFSRAGAELLFQVFADRSSLECGDGMERILPNEPNQPIHRGSGVLTKQAASPRRRPRATNPTTIYPAHTTKVQILPVSSGIKQASRRADPAISYNSRRGLAAKAPGQAR